MRAVSTFFLVSLLLVGCGSEQDVRPACYDAPDPSDCAMLYAPDFEQIFTRRLSVTCATSGGSCHGAGASQGGLNLADMNTAYAQLLGQDGGKARVVPGDPACSELMVRLDLADHRWSMPPGNPLDERERCTIRRWIADGARQNP